MPSDERGLHLPGRNRLQAGAVDLRLVRRVVDRQAEDRRPERRHRDADLGQEEEDEVELEHQRRAAEELHVGRERRAEPARPVEPAERDQEPGDDGERKREHRQDHGHAGRFEQDPPVAPGTTSQPCVRAPTA